MVTNGGNVGIGTTNPSQLLTVGAGTATIGFVPDATNGSYIRVGGTGGGSNVLRILGHSDTEKARFDGSGNLLVGATANPSGTVEGIKAASNGVLYAASAGTAPLVLYRHDSDGNILNFHRDGTNVGSIGIQSSGFYIDGEASHLGLRFGSGSIVPRLSGSDSDNTADLGESGLRFKDLHLSGRSYSDSASIGTTSTGYKLHLNAPVNSLACRIEGVKTTSTGHEMMSLVNNGTTGSASGYMITLHNKSSYTPNPVTLRGAIGLSSNGAGGQFSNPYIAHTSGTGIGCVYSGSSAYNGVYPCTNTGASNSGVPNLGTAAIKWNTVYATNSTINTSDRTEKQDIEALSDAETRVAVAAKGLLRKYRFISAVAEKGDNARIHFGIIAQDLQAAFEAEGLDAGRYAMFCSDTWYEYEGEPYPTQEEAPEGATEVTKLGVRYSELLAFIISAI
jgi:hypothetical protein